VVVEIPQLGHATYLFSKPANMIEFLALYAMVTREDILQNRSNVAEKLGFLGRIIHGLKPQAWLKELKVRLGEVVDYAEEEGSELDDLKNVPRKRASERSFAFRILGATRCPVVIVVAVARCPRPAKNPQRRYNDLSYRLHRTFPTLKLPSLQTPFDKDYGLIDGERELRDRSTGRRGLYLRILPSISEENDLVYADAGHDVSLHLPEDFER
jgi:hypothetical protein